jgi:hypothetical protein
VKEPAPRRGTEKEADMATSEEELRDQAVKRIKARRDLQTHLVTYLIVNAGLAAVWVLTGRGYFWPAWVLVGWGIGLAFSALAVYRPRAAVAEEEIRREVEKMRRGAP